MNEDQNITMQPVYLIVGDDALKRETVIARLRKRLESFGDLTFNSDKFQAGQIRMEELVASCETMPFASEYRLVELYSIEKIGKQDSELLIDYLKNPNPQCVLALIGEKLAKNTRLYKSINVYPKAVVNCDLPKASELPRLVKSIAVGQGCVLTDAAADMLSRYIGSDTITLQSEIKKLATRHKGNDPITESEVAELVRDKGLVKVWDLLDAYSDAQLDKCLLLLSKLQDESPFYILASLQGRIRELIAAREFSAQGNAALGKALGKQDWQIRNHRNWARKHTSQQLCFDLAMLTDCEQKMKMGSDSWLALENFFIRSLS